MVPVIAFSPSFPVLHTVTLPLKDDKTVGDIPKGVSSPSLASIPSYHHLLRVSRKTSKIFEDFMKSCGHIDHICNFDGFAESHHRAHG